MSSRTRWGAGAILVAAIVLVSGALAASDPGVDHGRPGLHAGHPGADDGATACAAARIEAERPTAASARTEPTEEQRRIDALSYELSVSLHPEADSLTGEVRMRGRVLEGPLSEIVLNMDPALRTGSVGGDAVGFVHDGDLLRLSTATPLSTGESFDVRIEYGGRPPEGPFNFDTFAGRDMIWSFSAPYGARSWWPCKDYPDDKADSVIVRTEVPEGLIVAGNGLLVDAGVSNGRAFYQWNERHPIATYLVFLTAHAYAVYEESYEAPGGGSLPLLWYNFPENASRARAVQDKVPAMFDAFVERFGAYPFGDEKYGHAEFLFSGGMENQTFTCLGSYSEMVVAHELAHQWWGDLVTCETFQDIWLNEGFATWSEALWAEALGGAEAYHEKMAATRYLGSGTVGVPAEDLGSTARIYDRQLSYWKGSWVVHMLRGALGDEDFFETLRTYRTRYAGATATTGDLRAVAEEISGRDLGAFFTQWIERDGWPIYTWDAAVERAGSAWAVDLRLEQLQAGTPFVMPVTVRVHPAGAGDPEDFRIEDDGSAASHRLEVGFEPATIEIDPDEWILRQVMPSLEEVRFERPILLVNGVPWNGSTGEEVRAFYEARAFTGRLASDFWDYHPAPAVGYPDGLAEPLGHGAPPAEVLERYEAVVWVGNSFGGDGAAWIDAPLYSFLQKGGSALLMTLGGRGYLPDPYREYLGIEWAEDDTMAVAYESLVGDLPDLRVQGLQGPVSLLVPVSGATDTQLLYEVAGSSPQRGLGVVRRPDGGHRGAFAFLSGRPYRWNSDDLRVATETILSRYLLAPADAGAAVRLAPPVPNPSRASARLDFFLPVAGVARLAIYDAAGREVRLLRDGASPAGWNGEVWDGRNNDGRLVPSGIYFQRLDTAGRERSGKVVRIR